MRFLLLSLALVGLLASPAGAIVWEWDCSSDPLGIDANGDGVDDWIERNGNSLDPAGFASGTTWRATHQFGELLDTRPKNPFNTPTSVDVRFRSYAQGDWQSTFWINVDYAPAFQPGDAGYTFAPIYAHLELMSDQTQTLTLYNVYTSWVPQVLGQYTGLRNDFIDLHMDFDTLADTVAVSIDGTPQGTYGYGVFGPQNPDAFATLLGLNGEFDYVRIEAADPAIIPEPASAVLLVLGGVLLLLGAARHRTRA